MEHVAEDNVLPIFLLGCLFFRDEATLVTVSG